MSQLQEFLRDIKVEHTVFALPFAYLTLFLAEGGWPRASVFGWITLAMIAGRTFGMAANRLIDAEIDARNPRTAARSIPAGRLRKATVIVAMAATIALFLWAVWNLAPLCRKLWPAVLVAMIVYPYAKRFTPFAHLFLGLVYFMIPTAIWIGVHNRLEWPAAILGVGAALWVAGFDIIYACQDAEVDKREGLHSIPADFGLSTGLWVSRAFHLVFVAALVAGGMLLSTGWLYFAAVGVTAATIVYEHRLVSPHDLSRVNAAFFTANGFISILLFVLVAIDQVWK